MMAARERLTMFGLLMFIGEFIIEFSPRKSFWGKVFNLMGR